ncbi:NUDIX domain-containing protein [Kribbella amoyensis]|uniref:NUDIX domain-containing protein n=2 Tax=Kribbella amoyensis TaxID=996641 RepID=A0A561B911_9ACTN|nr:NUDIX domain-containing protein [Kribbella amoyensis]
MRAGVVLRSEAGIAAIERVRDGQTYHVLPGGQVEDGETPAEAAARETYEELGLIVRIHGLVAVVHFGLRQQQYFLASVLGGEFGTGSGAEMASLAESERGSYRPVWLPHRELVARNLRPKPVAAALQEAADADRLLAGWLRGPVAFEER